MGKRLIVLVFILAFVVSLLPLALAEDDSEPIEIIAQPQNLVFDPKRELHYEVKANGSGLEFEWFIFINPKGTHKKLSHEEGVVLSLDEAKEQGYFYRAEVLELQDHSILTIEKLGTSGSNRSEYLLNYAYVFCVITDEYGNRLESRDAMVNLEINAPEPPEITVSSDLAVFSGQSFELFCDAVKFEREGEYDYQWYQSEDPDAFIFKYEKMENETRPILEISAEDVTEEKKVYYFCEVRHESDSEDATPSRSALIEVTVLPYSAATKIIDHSPLIDLSLDAESLFLNIEAEDNNSVLHEIELSGMEAFNFALWVYENKKYDVLNESMRSYFDITIVEQPANVMDAQPGDMVSFSCLSDENCTYTWFVEKPGEQPEEMNLYVAAEGAKTPVLTIQASEDWDGCAFYCEVENAFGNKMTTEQATLTLAETPTEITEEPEVLTEEPAIEESVEDEIPSEESMSTETNEPTLQDIDGRESDHEEHDGGVSTTGIVFLVISIILSIASLAAAVLLYMKLKK